MAKTTMAFLFRGITGSVGDATFVRTKRGTVVRERAGRQRTQTPAMVAAQERMRRASRAFGGLTREEASAWDRYAATLAAPDPDSGVVAAPSGQQAHNGLATRLLQMDPQAALPRLPPVGAFPGDGVRVSFSSPPYPPLQHEPLGEGEIRLVADVPNRPGVVTELLAQPLASAVRRTYLRRYRTAAFVAFAPGAMARDLPKGGPTAYAYRFVEAATGRTTATIEIGVAR